jgi:perosamine synthetase
MARKVSVARPIIRRREIRAVKKVLRSGSLAQGPEVAAFEKDFAHLVDGRDCIAVNSGTSALLLAVKSLGIGHGDEVIVPSFSFAASANAIVLAGAKPIFCDIDPRTFNIDEKSIKEVISSRTKAVLAVHLFGLMSRMNEIVEIAKKHRLLVIEDAAQAHLASISGKRAGTFGDAAAFSFYPTKNMTTGEGGMIVTSNSEVGRVSRLLRNQGMELRYKNEIAGFNMRMTDISAAIGREQIKSLKVWTEKRIRNAQYYKEGLPTEICPLVPEDYKHVFHQFTLKVSPEHREGLRTFLANHNIETGVYYPTPIHQLPAYNIATELPNTTKASKEVLSIPIHPKLSRRQLIRVRNLVAKYAEQNEM